jgi:hypothetical protein
VRLNPGRPCGWLIYSRYERNFGNYSISKKGLFFITKYNNFWLNYFFLESQKFFFDKQRFFFNIFNIDKSNIKSWFLLLTYKNKLYLKKKIILSALYFFPQVNFLWIIGGIIFGIEFLNKSLFDIWKQSQFSQKFSPFFYSKNGKVFIFKKIMPNIFFSYIFFNKYHLFNKMKNKFIKKPYEILSLLYEKLLKKHKSYGFNANLFFNLQESKNRKYLNEQDFFVIIFFNKKKKFRFKYNKFYIFKFLIQVSKNIIKWVIYLNSNSYFFFNYFTGKHLFENNFLSLLCLALKRKLKKVKINFIENKVFEKKQNFRKFYNNGLFEIKKEKIVFFHIRFFQRYKVRFCKNNKL